MNREAFDHAIRASGAILGEKELLVIGSQALHASVSDVLPPVAVLSVEADIAALDDPDEHKADLIDGSIGELSMFHTTFGYYAQGVTESTAILPRDWRNRLIRYETPGTNGVVAWCLDIHDLWISKAIAYRPKDLDFCTSLMIEGLVDADTLASRLNMVDGLDAVLRGHVAELIKGLKRTHHP